MEPIQIAAAAFAKLTGKQAAIHVRAPGRVNLIGEHTDYNEGFVLPCAIGKETAIVSARRDDKIVRVAAADYDGEIDSFRLDTAITPMPGSPWQNYVRGVFKIMQDAGYEISGADMAISGNIPQGAGLSSSASLEVGVALSLQLLWDLNGLDAAQIALLGQKAENEFVGCQCGIMDQMVSATGQKDHAIRIDCRNLEIRPVPIPDNLSIMIVHSGITHSNTDGSYNDRRIQCETAASILGVAALRDANLGMLNNRREDMGDLVYRRARHIITENQRTIDMSDALAANDIGKIGALMAQSHTSMRDDFEITVPGIDRLVEIMQKAIGNNGGARMTGGGFGGAAVGLLKSEHVPAVRDEILANYQTPAGNAPQIMIERPAGGASLVPRS